LKAAGPHDFKITMEPSLTKYPKNTMTVKVNVEQALQCKLAFDKTDNKKDFKYYITPYKTRPEDLVEYGELITVKIPKVTSKCTAKPIIYSFATTGDNLISAGCTTIPEDVLSMTIATACLQTVKPGSNAVKI